MTPLHLSPAEAAKALGVTRRALRFYEQRGLVNPLKTSNGYRVYGPATLARLHQVLALKRLGFTLASMHVVLSRSPLAAGGRAGTSGGGTRQAAR